MGKDIYDNYMLASELADPQCFLLHTVINGEVFSYFLSENNLNCAVDNIRFFDLLSQP